MFLTSLVMILYAGQEVTKKQHCVAGCYAASKCDIGWSVWLFFLELWELGLMIVESMRGVETSSQRDLAAG